MKLNVAVLMGGKTAEHEISLKSGEEVVNALDKNKYNVKPVKIKKNGEWLIPGGYVSEGKELDVREGVFSIIDSKGSHMVDITEENWPVLSNGNIEQLKGGEEEKIDVVFLALHGPFGEDGTVQGLLEMMNIPYTGSGVLASALAMDKAKCKEVYIYNNIKTPRFVTCDCWEWKKNAGDLINNIEMNLSYPCVVKPSNLGSSVGTFIVKSGDELKEKILLALDYDNRVIVEEYIKGTEITCPVLGAFAGEEPSALPLVEIIPPGSAVFFDYDVKYNGRTQEITPARISEELTVRAQELGIKVHKILGCAGLSRTDMIIKDNELYVLETNTIPGMTRNSLFPQAARAMGMSFPDLLTRLIELALDGHRHKKSKVERK